jgi:hypothetical protein
MDALQWMIWEDFRKPPQWNSMGLHRHQTIEEIVYDNHPGLVLQASDKVVPVLGKKRCALGKLCKVRTIHQLCIKHMFGTSLPPFFVYSNLTQP